MKIPKHIREKMHRVARLNALADYEMRKVECWLESKGFDITSEGGLRNGDGCSLEELEYGIDITDLLCERLETEAEELG